MTFPNTDFIIANHGSIITLTPMTAAAKEWAAEFLPDDAPSFGRGIAIEPRFIDPILQGIEDDGLTVV